ncbi:MAG: histidine triad nucleotide-binding protein [Bdellovibrionia bacterium]
MSDLNCLFCQMIEGKIPVARVFEDEWCICIRDIHPQAKIHLLVIPKRHVASLEAFAQAHPAGLLASSQDPQVDSCELLGNLLERAVRIAKQEGLLPSGFRTVINTNAHGGQSVFHLHIHLLGGEPLSGQFA